MLNNHFSIQLKKSWNGVWYDNQQIEPQFFSVTNGNHKTVSGENIYIADSYFINLHYNGPGGAVYFRNEDEQARNKLLIESSSFISCSAGTNGGAIYGYKGNLILNRVCSYNCNTTSGQEKIGQFTYAQMSDIDNIENSLLDSSISKSSSEDSGYTVNHYYGRIICKLVNI